MAWRPLFYFFFLMIRRPPRSPPFPYTALFRSLDSPHRRPAPGPPAAPRGRRPARRRDGFARLVALPLAPPRAGDAPARVPTGVAAEPVRPRLERARRRGGIGGAARAGPRPGPPGGAAHGGRARGPRSVAPRRLRPRRAPLHLDRPPPPGGSPRMSVAALSRMVKFEHSLFALPFAASTLALVAPEARLDLRRLSLVALAVLPPPPPAASPNPI